MELAVVRRLGDGKPSLAADNVPNEGGNADWARDDTSGVRPDELRKAHISTVLPTDAYSLQLVEAPNVPDAEMQEAVRWRIQHLIEFPVDEAVIDTFEMPEPANPGARPMIYAVVARRQKIVNEVERIRHAELHMDAIDIPELCMRNVAVCLPQDANGVAFLHFTDDCGYLTITRNGILYMIRRIETALRELTDAEDSFLQQERSASVSLEAQRSLDYFESHYDCRPVTELVLGPGPNLDSLVSTLAENLGISVTRLQLEDLFTLQADIPEDVQSDCLLSIGAALRTDAGGKTAA